VWFITRNTHEDDLFHWMPSQWRLISECMILWNIWDISNVPVVSSGSDNGKHLNVSNKSAYSSLYRRR
jgi:hypothetical protein